MLSLCRPFSKSQEPLPAPNLSIIPLAPPVHPGDSHAPCRGPAAISKPVQELHNGDVQLAVKPYVSRAANPPEDMDTDGEIDVDNCDDRECKKWTDPGVTSRKTRPLSQLLVLEQTHSVVTGRGGRPAQLCHLLLRRRNVGRWVKVLKQSYLTVIYRNVILPKLQVLFLI